MPFPVYVQTRNVSVGGAQSAESSEPLRLKVTVKASRSLIWSATGYRLESSGYTVTSEPGAEVVIPLPTTDVSGWKDGASGATLDVSAPGAYSHRYIASVSFLTAAGGSTSIPNVEIGPFVLPTGVGTVDLDTTVPTSTVAGDQVSVPDVWSTDIAALTAAFADLETSVSGTVPATPDTLVRRDEAGHVLAATPTDATHAATKAFTEAVPAVINAVTQFGATGAGVTDDSAALIAAIAHSLTRRPTVRDQNPRIVIPAGTYNIHANGLFSNFDFAALGLSTSTRNGITFVGEGRRATILRLITGGTTEKWFYNNGSISTQRMERLTFEGIRFETDDPEFGNGFKQFSQGGEKQFRFRDCDFNLGTILQCEGTGNADLNRFYACYIQASRAALVLNNNQSVANEFHGCDFTLTRSLITIQAGGGGSTKIIGGNLEMQPHGTETSTDHYLIDSPVTPATGQGNAEHTIADVRFEIHGANKKLVRTVGVTGQLNINFVRCQFGTLSGGAREVVSVTASRRVHFDNCILNSGFSFLASATFAGSSGNPSGAQIVFTGCDVGLDTPLHTRCTATGDTARIVATGCFRQNSSTSVFPKIAEDFDFGWRGRTPRGPSAAIKVASLKPVGDALPVPGAAASALPRVQLPAGAVIKRIVVKKPTHSGTGSTEVYRLHVGSADMATTLGSSVEGTWGGAHSIVLDDPGVISGTAGAGLIGFDTIALWATGGTIPGYSGGAGAVAYIEYI